MNGTSVDIKQLQDEDAIKAQKGEVGDIGEGSPGSNALARPQTSTRNNNSYQPGTSKEWRSLKKLGILHQASNRCSRAHLLDASTAEIFLSRARLPKPFSLRYVACLIAQGR